jgi:hypothetical protein
MVHFKYPCDGCEITWVNDEADPSDPRRMRETNERAVDKYGTAQSVACAWLRQRESIGFRRSICNAVGIPTLAYMRLPTDG